MLSRTKAAPFLSSESTDYYTPPMYTAAAAEVMGGIELDPASCEEANQYVRAARYFTKEIDGLKQSWMLARDTNGSICLCTCHLSPIDPCVSCKDCDFSAARSVFLNPPYGLNNYSVSNQSVWTQRAILEYKSGNINQCIILVNSQTGDQWFQPLWPYSICFVCPRIKFIAPGGVKKAQPTKQNVFVYIGPNNRAFADVFRHFGAITMAGTVVL